MAARCARRLAARVAPGWSTGSDRVQSTRNRPGEALPASADAPSASEHAFIVLDNMSMNARVFAGIRRLVAHSHPAMLARPDWAASIAAAEEMFEESGVEVARYDCVLGESVRFGGRLITV